LRLPEIERGDGLRGRMLIRLVSRMAGIRLPDAARVAFYHRDFAAGPALAAWTQQAMRGPGPWAIPERELMAAMVASWNSCPFCVGAHGAVAVTGIDGAVVDAVLADYRTAPIPERLRAALRFLEKMTRDPGALGPDDARIAIAAGLTAAELRDAVAVGAVFNAISRYANALDFEIPSAEDFAVAAQMLLRRGYA
jgi:uncharacterized peroxidase-related enzyme